jgi:hypothetical protein
MDRWVGLLTAVGEKGQMKIAITLPAHTISGDEPGPNERQAMKAMVGGYYRATFQDWATATSVATQNDTVSTRPVFRYEEAVNDQPATSSP